jgi:hypothetical protein
LPTCPLAGDPNVPSSAGTATTIRPIRRPPIAGVVKKMPIVSRVRPLL